MGHALATTSFDPSTPMKDLLESGDYRTEGMGGCGKIVPIMGKLKDVFRATAVHYIESATDDIPGNITSTYDMQR